MRPVPGVELEHDVADVMIDGLDTDREINGNFPVAFAEREISQYLYFARCESRTP